ncbi:hypothetical protein [Pseudomonas aegrilactucae]|uniref:Uncharacterized protein n=1 Tax=Pseudomonas aegrilactucae TaxID=2854028 RepID=A0A9Q2XIM2_9PSED|nr:hypothetical protein [Pseudomonas aegrilactucae]MBV6287383.1 hypothetical protein [Pseudomonas aegrilactucae]
MTDKEVFEEAPKNQGSGEKVTYTGTASVSGDSEGSAGGVNNPTIADKNWKDALSSVQHIKELGVIVAVSLALVWLLCILTGFVSSITELFTEAVRLHSAPVTVVKTMDWHVILIGSALILGVSAILIVLLKSVFDSGRSDKKTPDGLALGDMPFGEVVKSVQSFFQKK